jgi:hypothetical protein
MSIETTIATVETKLKAWAVEVEDEVEVVAEGFLTAAEQVVTGLPAKFLPEFKTLAQDALSQVGAGNLTGAETIVLNGASTELKAILADMESAAIQILIGLVAKIG